MDYKSTKERLAGYRRQIDALREKMRDAQASIEPEEVRDYEFATSAGSRRLSELFGNTNDLFVIHNMGSGCPYCTLWADGFNGIYHHLADRAAFVVSTPDPPTVQQKFAASRGWRFPMVSHQGSTFAGDMGYREEDHWRPGVSVFRRAHGRIVRVADTGFGPGDDFCSLWHFLDLLPEGVAEWAPKFGYA